MIGREDELRQLVRLAGTPGSEVAVLAGPPGIGKTRMVRELVAALPPRVKVLIGQAEPDSLSRPFELLLSALDRQAEVSAEELEVLTDSSLTLVERLRSALALVARVTAGGPALIVFEDLHWADPESVALFERIADLDGDRLLLGTYRPDEVVLRTPLSAVLDRIDRRHMVYHVRLERFTQAQTSAFLAAVTGSAPPYRAAVALHNRTGGDPFFLEELLRAGDDLQSLCDQPLPWSLAEALRRQVDHLEPSAQRLVEAAAVLGHRVPFDLLATVTGRDEDDLINMLRQLVAEGVLVETGSARPARSCCGAAAADRTAPYYEDEFAFRHALVREAISERLLGRERRRLHQAAYTALLAAGSCDWASVARHARGAGRYEDMLDAARRGAASSLEIASPFAALQLAELGLAEAPEDLELLALASRAAWLASLFDDAEAHGRRWQEVAPTPAERAAAQCLRLYAAMASQDHDLASALHAQLAAQLDELGPGPDQARAMSVLARSARLRGLDEEAMDWIERTVAETERIIASGGAAEPVRAVIYTRATGNAATIRQAGLLEKGLLLTRKAATLEAGRVLLIEVAGEAEELGSWLTATTALERLVELPPATSGPELAELLERMRRDADRAGVLFAAWSYLAGKARLHMRQGQLALAIEATERGRAEELGHRRTLRPSDHLGAMLAGLYLEANELERAAQVTAELVGVPGNEYAISGLEFHIACRRGDTARARALLDSVIADVAASGMPGFADVGRSGEFLHDLVSAAVEAPLTSEEIGKLIEGIDGPFVDAAYRRLVAGQYAEHNGDVAAALAHFTAAAVAAELPPAARGTAHIGAARALIALRRPDEARKHAQQAGKLLEHWPGWRSRQLDAVRSRLGIAAIAGPATHAGLTPREREVAVLVAQGLTNVEVARRLFISPRTAAVHVSSILRKLGISSRDDIGSALDDEVT